MEIILATNNHHKKEELSQILKNHRILTPDELGIQFYYEERGTNYFENAYGKAESLYRLINRPVIADDSGLSINVLEGAPGIFSARYGQEDGKNLSDDQKMDLILTQLKDRTDRSAAFVSCIVFIYSKYQFYSVQETLEGRIADSKRGKNGFGYDPIFFLPQYKKTVAELSSFEKNRISHRGKAGLKIANLIDSI